MDKYPSPLKAIRLHCLDCCLDQPQEVRLCGAGSCPSQILRLGKSVQGVRPLQVIKEHCIHCGGGEEAPKDCQVTDCILFPFRLGANPNRSGIGNHSPNQANLVQNKRTKDAIHKQTPCESSSCLCEEPCAVCACSDRGHK